MRGRALLVVVAAALTVVAIVPTGGFTAASADRSVQVAVVSDDEALVGIDPAEPTLDNGRHADVALLQVRNGFGEPVTVTASVARADRTGQPPTVRAVTGPGTLAPGESGAVTADAVCAAARETGTVTVELAVAGDGVDVTMERDVEITCTGDGRGVGGNETDGGGPPGDGTTNRSD